jgi:hypothetical protein
MAVTADRPIAGAAAAFVALAVVASTRDGGWLADADRALFDGVRAHRGRARTVVARIISAFGEPAVVYPVLLAGGGAARQAGWQRACVPCLVVASGAAARRRLSQVIARPRPPADAWLTVPEGYSLPSKQVFGTVYQTAPAWLLVLGRHGNGGVLHPRLGHVAETVAKKSGLPLLLLGGQG